MRTILLLVGVITITRLSEGKLLCKEDDDCDGLGDGLVCVKSACEWGTCGCRAGYTAKYVGSGRDKRFRCVTNKKIGQKCSTKGDEGVCIAPNSHCDLDSKKCECKTGYVPAWGGEACVTPADVADMCYSGSSSLSTCDRVPSHAVCHGAPYSVVPSGTGTCSCASNEQLDWVMLHGHTSFWYRPHCRRIRIGERCLLDSDCPDSGKQVSGVYTSGGNCDSNNRCVCEPGQVKNYDGSRCRQALNHGDRCYVGGSGPVPDRVCNGERGLICGDVCKAQDYHDSITRGTNDATCVCAPSHTTSGSTCNPIGVGGSCHGDLNCKAIGPLGVCVDGTCQNAGGRQVVSGLLSTVLPVMLYVIWS